MTSDTLVTSVKRYTPLVVCIFLSRHLLHLRSRYKPLPHDKQACASILQKYKSIYITVANKQSSHIYHCKRKSTPAQMTSSTFPYLTLPSTHTMKKAAQKEPPLTIRYSFNICHIPLKPDRQTTYCNSNQPSPFSSSTAKQYLHPNEHGLMP